MAEMLINEGALVRACDPLALQNAKKAVDSDKVSFFEDPYCASKGLSCIYFGHGMAGICRLGLESHKKSNAVPVYTAGRPQCHT